MRYVILQGPVDSSIPTTDLDAGGGEVWDLELDVDGRLALAQVPVHAGQEELGLHQVLLAWEQTTTNRQHQQQGSSLGKKVALRKLLLASPPGNDLMFQTAALCSGT